MKIIKDLAGCFPGPCLIVGLGEAFYYSVLLINDFALGRLEKTSIDYMRIRKQSQERLNLQVKKLLNEIPADDAKYHRNSELYQQIEDLENNLFALNQQLTATIGHPELLKKKEKTQNSLKTLRETRMSENQQTTEETLAKLAEEEHEKLIEKEDQKLLLDLELKIKNFKGSRSKIVTGLFKGIARLTWLGGLAIATYRHIFPLFIRESIKKSL